jgi:transposase
MARTERQIAEYVEYFRTAPKEERAWALERIAEQEHKSPAEIRAICEKYKALNLRKGVPAPDDLKEKIGEKILAGMSTPELTKKYGVSDNLVMRVRQELRDKGEKIPENRGGSPKTKIEPVIKSEEQKQLEAIIEPKQPEAYPGQIYDDHEVEEDVKTYLPHEKSVAGECKVLSWFEMIDALQATAQVIFGKSVNIIEMFASGTCKTAFVNVVSNDWVYCIEVRANG